MAETIKKETVAAPKKEKTVTVYIPKAKKDEDDLRVWVNDRSWLIKKGVKVEVPECVAKVLEHRQAMLDKIMNFEANKVKVD